MDNVVYNKPQKNSFRKPIILLSIVGLIFTVLSCIEYFAYYEYIGDGKYELTVGFPSVFGLLSLLLHIAPCVLLVLYMLKFHKEFKATIIVPIIFGLIAFNPLYCLIIFWHRFWGILIFDIPVFIAFGLATHSALKGFPKKISPIIAIVVGLLREVLSVFFIFSNIGWYWENGEYLYLFTKPIGVFGTIAFYVALLLFVLKNRIPAVISVFPEKKNAEKTNPEQALKVLKDKLDFGMITEEEYQAKRAEIISKL